MDPLEVAVVVVVVVPVVQVVQVVVVVQVLVQQEDLEVDKADLVVQAQEYQVNVESLYFHLNDNRGKQDAQS